MALEKSVISVYDGTKWCYRVCPESKIKEAIAEFLYPPEKDLDLTKENLFNHARKIFGKSFMPKGEEDGN